MDVNGSNADVFTPRKRPRTCVARRLPSPSCRSSMRSSSALRAPSVSTRTNSNNSYRKDRCCICFLASASLANSSWKSVRDGTPLSQLMTKLSR